MFSIVSRARLNDASLGDGFYLWPVQMYHCLSWPPDLITWRWSLMNLSMLQVSANGRGRDWFFLAFFLLVKLLSLFEPPLLR